MYDFLQPQTLEQAVKLLAEKPEPRVLAGGTDLIIALKNKAVSCGCLIDYKKIPSLNTIRVSEEGLEIGAAVTCSQILESDVITGAHKLLKQAAAQLANSLLRNRATLAGNLCNASPGGDLLTACLVLDAWVEAVSQRGTRRILLKDFFKGVKRHALSPDELLTKVVFPPQEGVGRYLKKKRIRGHDLAQVGVSAFYHSSGRLSMAFGAVGPTPILLDNLGTYTKEQLAAQREAILDSAVSAVRPIGDVRSSKNYRLAMVRHLSGKIIDELSGVTEAEA